MGIISDDYDKLLDAEFSGAVNRRDARSFCVVLMLEKMLEKMLGCTLLTKLRAILIMEADFNHSNKEIFGFRML